MSPTLTLMIMSGVEDGRTLTLNANESGLYDHSVWMLLIGRQDTRDIALKKDTFISREHARLTLRGGVWNLIDLDSRNGTFIEVEDDEQRVTGETPVQPGQLFRIGRTWLRIQPEAIMNEAPGREQS
jgi:pSer/pThr/pTyr-binding forkhead associated (FHA) protein